jgi:predicted CoA-binding protein
MPNISSSPDAMRDLLTNARVIAVVGASNKPDRPSYSIYQYLKRQGYTVYPVNPIVKDIDGDKVYPSLADVPESIDIVDIFRPSDALPEVIEDAIAAGAKAVWAQLGINNDAAAERAEAAGLNVVMNKCIKVQHSLLVNA